MTAKEVYSAITAYFRPPKYCTLGEVTTAVSMNKTRRSDAIVMELTGKKRLIGLEIKVSQKDLDNELKTLEKSWETAKFCDAFYLVVPYDLHVFDGDVPDYMGIIVLDPYGRVPVKRKTYYRKPSVKAPSPIPEDVKSFMACLGRRFSQELELAQELERVLTETTSKRYWRLIGEREGK